MLVNAPTPTARRIRRIPGVYRPQDDTHLLAGALAAEIEPGVGTVLDYCTGSGVLAVAAAELGAAQVTAIDVSRRAVACSWANTRNLPVGVVVRRGGLDTARDHGPYDLVLSNPPYVPATSPSHLAATRRQWDGGGDGRAVLGPLCEHITELLNPGGTVLLVHSELSGPDRTLAQLRAWGLTAGVVARARIPFGPVLRRQLGYLTARGLIGAGQSTEDLVVIRGDRPTS